MRIDIVRKIDYWLGIEEHQCKANRPIGGCLVCDLEAIRAETIRRKRANEPGNARY